MDPYLTLYTKINSKWTQDLNVRPATGKLLEKKNIGKKLLDIGLGNNILGITAKATKAKICKWHCLKQKAFAQQRKQAINQVKRLLVEWKKIFSNHISVRGLISNIYKEHKQVSSKKTNNLIKKWAKVLNRLFP